MADSKKYDGSQWEHSLRKLTTAIAEVETPLYSDGTAITAYTIKGNTVQDGTPTPSNPVEVNGVGVRTENLFDFSDLSNGAISPDDGVTIIDNNQKHTDSYISVKPSTNYMLSGLSGFSVRVHQYTFDYVYLGSSTYNQTFSTQSTCAYIRIASSTIPELLMITEGSTVPSSYIPYGYKIPISNGGVTTNIYLGSTQTVRQIKKVVFDGTEDWQNTFGVSLFGVQNMFASYPFIPQVQAYCTHCTYNPVQSSIDANTRNGDIVLQKVGSDYNVYIKNTDYTTNEDFKAWLATQYANGTPVTLYYVLAAAETGTVNEPLMKIGDYADTLSNATAIPTTEGVNSITVDTTVQPSEFTATWTGWHDASVKEKSENLFDKSSCTDGYEISAGEIRPSADWSVSDYIQVDDGMSYYGTNTGGSVILYDSQKNKTRGVDGLSTLGITVSANEVYMRINLEIANKNTAIVSTEGKDIPYEPYWK